MFKRSVFVKAIQANDQRTSPPAGFVPKRHPHSLRTWTIVFSGLVFMSLFSASVEAGMVYGRVYVAESTFEGGDTITIVKEGGGNPIEVKTDPQKGYSVFLEEGIYRVTFSKDGRTWEAHIRSLPHSVRQDIFLKEVR